MEPTILLFDIDGTLLGTDGSGRRAMERAFTACHAAPEACRGLSFAGMTDPAIVRFGLERIGTAPCAAAIDGVLRAYVSFLDEELGALAQCTVFPGVVRSLGALGALQGLAIGVGTGNIREGAERKLRRAALSQHFSFGGYGCDDEHRAELLRVGARRGAEQLRLPVEACRVVVIGDTPKDIAAARAIGAQCLAVATGSYSMDELKAHAPTWALENLDDPRAMTILGGGA